GCVATAMAQIIRYWEQQSTIYPTYNFFSMQNIPSIFYDNSHLARLMRDCGTTVNMNYGCDGSGISNSSIIKTGLINDFGFSSNLTRSSYSFDDRWTVKSEIDNNRPLLFGGFPSQFTLLWWTWGIGSGHEWVCDGYKLIRDADCKTTF